MMTEHWSKAIELLSPSEQRNYWIAHMKIKWGVHRLGLQVNRTHCPILSQHKVLRYMIEDGTLIRKRESTGGNSKATILYLPEHLKETV